MAMLKLCCLGLMWACLCGGLRAVVLAGIVNGLEKILRVELWTGGEEPAAVLVIGAGQRASFGEAWELPEFREKMVLADGPAQWFANCPDIEPEWAIAAAQPGAATSGQATCLQSLNIEFHFERRPSDDEASDQLQRAKTWVRLNVLGDDGNAMRYYLLFSGFYRDKEGLLVVAGQADDGREAQIWQLSKVVDSPEELVFEVSERAFNGGRVRRPSFKTLAADVLDNLRNEDEA